MTEEQFAGFERPRQNWSKLPHSLINCLPLIDSLGELKVVLYILRHTWGFSEFGQLKKITLDEFMHGRRLKNRSRMDNGTGLSKPTIITALRRAEEHGFIISETDDHDPARVKKFYTLNMTPVLKSLTPDVKELDPRCKKTLHRTEKETIERNHRETEPPPNSETPILQDEASSLPASTEDPRLTRLRQKFGDDPLSVAAHCAAARQAANVPADLATRPRPWQTESISDAEFQVCQRVADLWSGGKMAGLPRFVDSQVEAAGEVLRLFDGDLSQALETITLYHEYFDSEWQRTGRAPFSVVGPQSLVNVLRSFEAEAGYEAEALPRAERFLF